MGWHFRPQPVTMWSLGVYGRLWTPPWPPSEVRKHTNTSDSTPEYNGKSGNLRHHTYPGSINISGQEVCWDINQPQPQVSFWGEENVDICPHTTLLCEVRKWPETVVLELVSFYLASYHLAAIPYFCDTQDECRTFCYPTIHALHFFLFCFSFQVVPSLSAPLLGH